MPVYIWKAFIIYFRRPLNAVRELMTGVYLISIHYLLQAAIERSERAEDGCIFDKDLDIGGASLSDKYLCTGGASIYRLCTHACMDASLFSGTQGETFQTILSDAFYCNCPMYTCQQGDICMGDIDYIS